MRRGPIAFVLGSGRDVTRLAPVIRRVGRRSHVIYTGGHQDEVLTDTLLDSFVPGGPPAVALGLRSVPRGVHVASVVRELGRCFARQRPSALLVHGNDSSAVAGALAGEHAGVPVLHVGAGRRSFDRRAADEVSSKIIASIASLHCSATSGDRANLIAEGVPHDEVRHTGSTVHEAVHEFTPGPEQVQRMLTAHGAVRGRYVLATIERSENVGNPERLEAVLESLRALKVPVLFPAGQGIRAALRHYRLGRLARELRLTAPLDQTAFLGLAAHARLLVTDCDSGQEEATVLKKPVIVVGGRTAFPEAVTAGFAMLAHPGRPLVEAAGIVLDDDALECRLVDRPSPFSDRDASLRLTAAAAEVSGAAVC